MNRISDPGRDAAASRSGRFRFREPAAIVLLGVLLFPSLPMPVARAGGISPERQRELLHEAASAFDEAVSVTQKDPSRAQELYRTAAAGFQALVDGGLHNSAIEYNLGNTCFRLGRLGQAIVHYRRGLRLDPANDKLAANLDYVRRQVEPYVEPGGEDRLMRRLMFWQYSTSLAARTWLAALLSAAGWLLLIARLRWRSRPLASIGFVCIALGLATGASAIWQINEFAQTPAAVVIRDDQTLRLGRGESYDAALKHPLGPGVEVRILQQRGDWVEVRLLNNQTGWLPADAIERV